MNKRIIALLVIFIVILLIVIGVMVYQNSQPKKAYFMEHKCCVASSAECYPICRDICNEKYDGMVSQNEPGATATYEPDTIGQTCHCKCYSLIK